MSQYDPQYPFAPTPAKKKPRGRPFARGTDPRRNGVAKVGETCPACKAGTVAERGGKYGTFLGCSRYPSCAWTQKATAAAPPAAAPAATEPAPAWMTPASTMMRPAAPEPSSNGTAPAAPAAPAGSLEKIISDIAIAAAAQSVNETRVHEIVAAALQAHSDRMTQNVSDIVSGALAGLQAPQAGHFHITVNAAPTVTIQGIAHKALPRLIKVASCRKPDGTRRFNIMLVGPAGAGKTYLGEQLAEALGLKYDTLSLAPGLPESAIIGRMIPNLMTGTDHYAESAFVRRYRDGGVFQWDEVDNGDASTLNIVNSALANGHMTLPNGEVVTRHPDFICIASANTYGDGQTRQYVGRAQLDGAFKDRFVGTVLTLDYDAELERYLCPEAHIRDRVIAIREKCRSLNLPRIVSTRAVMAARALVLEVGDTVDDAMLAITEGWTIEDRRAVGVKVAS